MPYQPGPFGQATPADIHVSPGVYDFTTDAEGLQSDLAPIAAGWDSIISDMENFAVAPWDAELGLDLDGMLTVADAYGGSFPPASFDEMLNGWFDAQTALDGATLFAPAQAWQDPGAPFEPPDSALTLVTPQIDQTALTPAPNITVGGLSNGQNPFVGLFNVQRYGSQNFSVGDDFEAIALGPAGSDVTLSSTLNGEKLPDVDYGQIDATGQMFIKGTIGPEAVGVWSEQWYIDGQLLASFNFVVSPAAAQ